MAPALPDRLRGKRGGGITSAPEAGPVAALTASTFGALSRLRGKRIFHPHGVGFAGRLTPHLTEWSGAELLAGPEPRPVIARLSRSLGLPGPFPEPLGLALRAPDAYGPGRLLLGSDFPWIAAEPGYAETIDAVESHFADLPEADRARIRGGNALELFAF